MRAGMWPMYLSIIMCPIGARFFRHSADCAECTHRYNNTIFTSLMVGKKSTPEGNAIVLGGGSHIRRPVAMYININIIVIMHSRAYIHARGVKVKHVNICVVEL